MAPAVFVVHVGQVFVSGVDQIHPLAIRQLNDFAVHLWCAKQGQTGALREGIIRIFEKAFSKLPVATASHNAQQHNSHKIGKYILLSRAKQEAEPAIL